jgi:hypothetical protein
MKLGVLADVLHTRLESGLKAAAIAAAFIREPTMTVTHQNTDLP